MAYVQRLRDLANNRCNFLHWAWGELMHTITQAETQLLLNAPTLAFTDTNDPTLSTLGARMARAVWMCRHGHRSGIYRAIRHVLDAQLDQVQVNLSAQPPAPNPVTAGNILHHLLWANHIRPPGLQITRASMGTLILRATRTGSPLAIGQIATTLPFSLDAQTDLPQAIHNAVRLHQSAALLTALNQPNVLQLQNGLPQTIRSVHMTLALENARNAADLDLLYGVFGPNNTPFNIIERQNLDTMRFTHIMALLSRDTIGQAPATAAEVQIPAFYAARPIGSANAVAIIRAILTVRPTTGLPHPNRANLVPVALQLVQQVTDLGGRIELQMSDDEMPEFANYDAETNTFEE